LVMLDLSFPATIRNRALYMGSMFRIGLEGIYIVGLAAIGALAAAGAFPNLGPERSGTASTRDALVAIVFAHVIVLAMACFARVDYRKSKRGGSHKPWAARREVTL